ncbi:hypothetical protein ETU08_09090 [Apibacter muscae]|uniref:hypothetical protein n=1 Tax=Apibacter muscae TaxID=2509004 RepID=UPI0011AD07A2|nr:hypothetical protein [Apibacter muscae]TWP28389.1 hypothetical protein ETU08_09090 [Apibacter muscae]
MTKKIEIENILNKIASLHIEDDYAFNKYFDKILELLKNNESEAIHILTTLSEKDIDWLTPMFEDLSAEFQSYKFILCLEEIKKKYPNIHLIDESIQWAKDAMDE